MDSDLAFVKEQISSQERMAAKYADQPHRAGMHLATAHRFRALAERWERIIAAPRADSNSKVNICLSDLEGLPDELMSELSISDTDKQEMVIEDIIAKNNGVISLDKLLICFFRRENQVIKRSTFVSKLYRMGEKGMIFNVPGKRGYYSTYEMSADDVKRVFGSPDKISDEQSTPQDASPAEENSNEQTTSAKKALKYLPIASRTRHRRRRVIPTEADFV